MRPGRWVRARFGHSAAILLYHRVAEIDVDPWGLAVSPAHFEAHLDVIRSRATVLPLPELIRRLDKRDLPRRAIVVTFDDGYADNLVVAKPALERHGIPAAAFITTGPLGGRGEFWWDELEALLLTSKSLRPTLELEIAGQAHRWTLDVGTVDTLEGSRQHRHWRAWDTPPTPRHAAFAEIWRRLRILCEPARRDVLDRLAIWAGRTGTARGPHRTLSTDELRQLSRGGLVDVGAHTVTHSRLSALPDSDQRTELVASRQHLEDILGRPVTTMSYPFGGPEDYTTRTVSLAREAGFSCACTSVSGPVRADADLFRLPRCVVPDVEGDRFEKMLDRWLEAA